MPDSTLVGLDTGAQQRPAVWVRRTLLGALLLVVLAGLLGLLGVRTTTAVDEANGYALSVEYASVARAGLDVPWRVTVRHEGGFDKTLTLAVTADYFDIYETQGFLPDPASSVRSGQTLYLTFDAPPGDTFTLTYDAYIQPASQRGRDATVAVLGAGGVPEASVHIATHLVP